MNMALSVAPLFDVAVEETCNPAERDWLSVKAVIDKTGISKNDLIRFIQLKVLPESMMRVSPAGRSGGRKISAFSASILGHVAMLKLLRDEGHSVETIASELRQAEETPAAEPENELPPPTPASPLPASGNTASLYFHLPADAIDGSAFFVNRDMQIGWFKAAGDDPLFPAVGEELNDDPSGTVFDILLRASLKERVFNWQPLFIFIYRFLRDTTPPAAFNRLAPKVSMNLEAIGRANESGTNRSKTRPSIDSCPIQIKNEEGLEQDMQLNAVALSEGTLFIFEQSRHRDLGDGGQAGGPGSRKDSAEKKKPFSVLSARLDDSRRIVDTLLPETYVRLMTRIWDESDRIVQSYGGQRAKRSGTDIQYIIPRRAGTDPSFDAICCAVELREKLCEIEEAMKTEGDWFADIRLNIGISSGRDHLPDEDLTASVAFMLPGGAADQAFHLSALAQKGGILITKSAFSHLEPRQMEDITFGIYRDDRLIQRIFTRAVELPQGPETPPLGREIASLFVTRIIDVRSEEPCHADK
jgi:class 3 adenylate cyclase